MSIFSVAKKVIYFFLVLQIAFLFIVNSASNNRVTAAATLTVCFAGIEGQNGCNYVGSVGISKAILAANSGDTVLIKNGTYSQAIIAMGTNSIPAKSNIFIKGESLQTIITGNLTQQTVYINNSSNINISNLTIQKSSENGIFVTGDSYLSLNSVHIKDNIKSGIHLSGQASLGGRNILIENNTESGYVMNSTGTSALRNTTIVANKKIGYWAFKGNSVITSSIVAFNIDPDYAGIICQDSASLSLSYSISSQNTSGNFYGYAPCQIQKISTSESNPLFVSTSDFHLQTNSPAKDSGDPAVTDPDTSRSDMGVYGGAACDMDKTLPGCTPSQTTFVTIGGYIKSTSNGGVTNVLIRIVRDDNQVREVSTNAQGYFEVKDFIPLNRTYAVRIVGNLNNPQTAPSGYKAPAKTVTANQVWDYCTNDREIPVGSLSYECQSTGNNRSCAEADSSGVALRCNFVYEFDEDSCPRRAEGNANCDKNTQGVGVINIDDFDIWRREYLKELNTTSADFVDPAGVGLEDFDKWRITFTSN